MKRFLIFLLLFPVLATASFFVVIYLLTGAEVDSFSGPAMGCLLFVGPGLVVALVDWCVARTRIPNVVATTVFAYAVSVAWMAWDLGLHIQVLAIGLIGGIPAAVCSWLANRQRENVRNETRLKEPARS